MMTKLAYSLGLISGPPRSGTTWLARELSRGRDTFGFLPECTLLTQQVDLFHKTLKYCDKERFLAYFGTTEELTQYYQANITRMLELVARLNVRTESKLLLLKDPELSHHVDQLKAVVPAHKLVIIVRDPRDVLASYCKVLERKGIAWDLEKAIETVFPYYYSLGTHIGRSDEDRLYVQYEDLVVNGLSSVQRFLGLNLSDGNTQVSNLHEVGKHISKADPFFSKLYLQPTTTEKIGSYTSILSEQDSDRIDEVFLGTMDRWGYSF